MFVFRQNDFVIVLQLSLVFVIGLDLLTPGLVIELSLALRGFTLCLGNGFSILRVAAGLLFKLVKSLFVVLAKLR